MSRFVVIPARGGSKRLPNKNILPLNGKPLIHHTIDAVLGEFDIVIISTDSDRIIDTVRSKYDDSSIRYIKRNPKLATDTSKVLDTMIDIVGNNSFTMNMDEVWMCLPTCPLRTKKDVKKAISMLDDNCDGVLSITDMEFPPRLGFSKGENGRIADWHYSMPFHNGDTRSQDHDPVYRPNGAIYGMKISSFKLYKSWYRGFIKGMYMPRERSVDIDTGLDFKMAELMLEKDCLWNKFLNSLKKRS